MKVLNVNLNNCIKSEELLSLQKNANDINQKLLNKTVDENEWLGWIDLPQKEIKDFEKMKKIIDLWRQLKVEVVVVIGIGGSYLGAKAGYEFLKDSLNNKVELLFAGNSVSAETLVSQLKYVEDKKFAINVISKSGTTLEPSIAFREFRKLLEGKVGIQIAKDLIVATTDSKKGILHDLAIKKNYQCLIVPEDVGGRFSVLSSVGIFPFMCVGIDVINLLKGAKQANKDANEQEILKNDVYKYAVARYILSKDYKVEMMVSYEPKNFYLAEWWKQLFAESEGKNGKGLLPTSCIFSTDLHSLGQIIQDGPKIIFETVLMLNKSNKDIILQSSKSDEDKLNYLNGKTLHQVNWSIFEATLDAHNKIAKIPNIVITFEEFNEYTLGYLFQFFERAVAISAYLLGVNPFNQPGVEIYKNNMFKILRDEKIK